jgi:phosphoglycolate phosphatase
MSETPKLVVFDCDGTLVDSQYMIVGAMHSTYAALDLTPLDDARVRSIVGLSLVEAMAELKPDATHDFHRHMAEIYKKEFYRLRTEEATGPDPLFPGTLETLQTLNEAGYLMGVATGNSNRGLGRVIEEHGLEQFFVTLQTADNHPSKPHPSMIETAMAETGAEAANTYMIGDTSYDMMMARSAGCRAIGVNWGYHSENDLKAGGAEHILSTYDPLAAILKGER